MRIVICDHESQDLEQISAMLGEYGIIRSLELDLYSFHNATELLCGMKGGEYDVILLNILMPGFDGIQTARELRTLDQNVRLLFLSHIPELAVESYAVGAYYYLLKPVTAESLFPLLDKIHSELNEQEKEALLLKSRDGFVSIPYSRLEYVDVMNKTLSFHLTDGSVREIKAPLADFEDAILSHPEFIKVHRSYLLNLRQLQSLGVRDAVTRSGHTVPIARPLYASAKTAYLDLMFQPQPAPSAVAPALQKASSHSGPWRILMVDDEPEDITLWSEQLWIHGCIVETAGNGADALLLAASSPFDCVLLDVMLPGEDGFKLCSHLKEQTGAPVIFLSCLTDSQKQLQGFISGGIDYITKDTPADLFWAKVETRIRLTRMDRMQLSFGPLLLDFSNRKAFMEDDELILTPAEFDLLWLMAGHGNRVYTPEELYRSVWVSQPWDGGHTVQVHMSRLRHKLKKAYPRHDFLDAVWGQGYCFMPMVPGEVNK